MADVTSAPKPLVWIGSSLDDVRDLPKAVRIMFGTALYAAQLGGRHRAAKPLKGFGGAGVIEIIEDHDGETYRAVYTVKLAGIIYVLDVFHKKSKKGISTPKPDIDRIRRRLKSAQLHHDAWLAEGTIAKEKKP